MEQQADNQAIARIVEQAMADFLAGMEEHAQFGIRIGRRTTQIIRFGMLAIAILGAAMFYLITILTTDFSHIVVSMSAMAGNIEHMEQNFQTVSVDLAKIEKAVTTMVRTDLASLPSIDKGVQAISEEMVLLRHNMESVNDHMQAIQTSVGHITQNMGIMTGQLGELNMKMGVMSGQMHDISRPMRMFPFN